MKGGVRKFLYDNGLTLVFVVLFLGALAGQAVAGYHAFNADQVQHSSPTISFMRYLSTSAFGAAVMENWQSEYLQFTLFILLTVWVLQRGSPESKELGKEGGESDEEQQLGRHAQADSPYWARVGGARTWLYSNSLVIVMAVIWVWSWAAQSVTGVTDYNASRLEHHQDPITWFSYLGTADFWHKTLQNWQSEFLAIASIGVLAVYLRQRGSPQSKPVGAPHDATGVEG